MHKVKIITLFLGISVIIFSCNSGNETDPAVYHTPETLENYLYKTSRKYPQLTYLEPAGTSEEGRTIWAISVSDNPLVFEPEPRIRLTGSIHGDENATTEMLIRFIDYLLTEYMKGNSAIRNIVDNRYIVIIPIMNPDGVYLNQRTNINYVDLNRNFSVEWTSAVQHGSSPFSETETQAIRDYTGYMVFHSSLTFHTGAVIVNMPFDYASEHLGGDMPAESTLVDYLAQEYSTSGSFLDTPGLLSSSYETDGTINGGDWYVAYGTLQDWSYKETGCIDLTVEISATRPESVTGIDELFEYNRDSILAYIQASGTGVFGRVINSSGDPVNASVTIDIGDIVTKSDGYGYYHRILLPGNYIITFSAAGYQEYSEAINIDDVSIPLELDVTLNSI